MFHAVLEIVHVTIEFAKLKNWLCGLRNWVIEWYYT